MFVCVVRVTVHVRASDEPSYEVTDGDLPCTTNVSICEPSWHIEIVLCSSRLPPGDSN